MIYGGHQESGIALATVFNVENRIPITVMNGLRDKGYKIESIADDDGRVNGVVIDLHTGFYLGGADL